MAVMRFPLAGSVQDFFLTNHLQSFYHDTGRGIELSILSQLDLVHTSTSHYLKIHFNIILPYRPEYSK
jgi:hypothetical protein